MAGNSNACIVVLRWIHESGQAGSGPGEFDTARAAMDSGRLFVADRGNNRIEIFDQDGVLAEWKQFGRPSGIYIDKRDTPTDTQSDDDQRRLPAASGRQRRTATPGAGPTPTRRNREGRRRCQRHVGALTAKQTLKKYVKK